MSARVSTLLNLEPAGSRYIFLLVSWNDYADTVRDELNRQADAFGLDLGPEGWFVQAYPQRMYEITEQVIAKSWPKEISDRFDSDPDPIILIFESACITVTVSRCVLKRCPSREDALAAGVTLGDGFRCPAGV
jgi:hypothetical protein